MAKLIEAKSSEIGSSGAAPAIFELFYPIRLLKLRGFRPRFFVLGIEKVQWFERKVFYKFYLLLIKVRNSSSLFRTVSGLIIKEVKEANNLTIGDGAYIMYSLK